MKSYLVIFIVILVIKQLLWSVIIPIWQNPDETAHFSYIQELVETRQIPFKGHGSASEEMVESLRLSQFDKIVFHPNMYLSFNEPIVETKNTVEDRKTWTSHLNSADFYPPGYYSLASLAYLVFFNASLPSRLYAVRIVGILFYLGTIWFSIRFSKLAFPESNSARWLFLVFIAFNPLLSEIESAVNNDLAVNFVGFAICYFILSFLKGKSDNWKRWLLYGSILAYGILSKPTVLFWYPVLLIVMYLGFDRLRIEGKGMIHKIIAFLSPQIVVILWIAIFNMVHYGSLIGSSILLSYTYQRVSIWDALSQVIHTQLLNTFVWMYWGGFGWVDTFLPHWIYRIITLLTVLFIFLTIILLIRKEHDYKIIWMAFIAHGIWGIILYGIGYISLSHGQGWFVQGRYFFSLMPFYVYLLISGLRVFTGMFKKIVKTDKIEFLLFLALGATILMLHNYSLFIVVTRRFYGF